jgi:hypothetical protein
MDGQIFVNRRVLIRTARACAVWQSGFRLIFPVYCCLMFMGVLLNSVRL